MIFGRLPAVWIGLIVSLVIGILTAVSGPGIIVAGNTAQTIANLITVLAPVISGFIIHNFVTPVAAPQLPAGTVVKVQGSTKTTVVG
ncbi:MAG TPA: hypothetical protein VK600_00340 [Candidatus Saccharimonadales bacterium]|nr:hypothetical protein [Candidatus Saccharimonadales bacterium]